MANNVLGPSAKLQEFNTSGEICSGCYLYTYDSGTTTPRATKISATGSDNTNPIVLDSDGRADVWLDDGEYRFELRNADDSTVVYTKDNIRAITPQSGTATFSSLTATGVDIRDLDGVINIGHRYTIDATESDQWAAGSALPVLSTVKDYVDDIGGSERAILLFNHSTDANTTSYFFGTSETVTSNMYLEVKNGALLDIDANRVLTIESPDHIIAGLDQVIVGGSGSVTFASGESIDSTGTLRSLKEPAYPSDEDLVGYWPFTDGGGLIAVDASMNDNNGTLEGTMTSADWIQGPAGPMIDFDGIDDRVDCGNSSPIDTLGDGSFSVSFFMNSGASINSDGRLFSVQVDPNNNFYLAGTQLSNGLVFAEEVSSSTNSVLFDNSQIFDQTSHAVCFVWDKELDLIRLYIDGKFADSQDISSWHADISNGANLAFGAQANGADPYLGAMAHCRVYDVALTGAEAKALYLTPAGTPTRVSFDQIYPVKDEDNMSSDSDIDLATQQSIKAYVDAQVATNQTEVVNKDVYLTGISDNDTATFVFTFEPATILISFHGWAFHDTTQEEGVTTGTGYMEISTDTVDHQSCRTTHSYDNNGTPLYTAKLQLVYAIFLNSGADASEAGAVVGTATWDTGTTTLTITFQESNTDTAFTDLYMTATAYS